MALRRKRPALKSDAMKKFLEEFFAKATDPVPDSEVKKAAEKRGLNLNMLDEISRGYVDKKRGPGGVYYWSKRTASAYLSDTAAAARKNSVAFKAGYEEAITSMLWSVNSIFSATSDKKSKELCSRLYAAIEPLREKRDSM